MHKLILMVLFDLSDEYVIGPPNNSLPRGDPFGRADPARSDFYSDLKLQHERAIWGIARWSGPRISR